MRETNFQRRLVLKATGGLLLAAALPRALFAQQAQQQEQQRRFDPQPGEWKGFEVVTRIDLQRAQGPSTVWVPLPAVDTDWQRTLSNSWSGNAKSMRAVSDSRYGAKYLVAEFDGSAPPVLEVVSRVQTRDRGENWKSTRNGGASAEDLRLWLKPTDLMPLDGIVLKTANQIVAGARTDEDKVQRIYDWILLNTFREPKVKGCGLGDIKTMLETSNLSGKCADLNGLFVGLCRAVGVPARDVYGVRIAPSAFGYRELGGKPAALQGAQHCRAEVYLKRHGWVAMDPADVTKVMRQETAEWIKDPDHPVVAPVKRALFGGWEGNWMGYNFAHDVPLQGSKAIGKVGFLMYPQAENRGEPYDPLNPDAFKYVITARAL
ncbi:transglutaminase family protein [Massilia forsythiae]|uniref:Transglutaminase family protein n=1 Tax=Massilia forsythiae TaxID=2728020 RepID=A0A7Z2ZVK5_9BURK|nr:transglutaminase family protein [Massilia forsythiae]QJE02202.1 transglutaminase family protein [Massilia forsythiae]